MRAVLIVALLAACGSKHKAEPTNHEAAPTTGASDPSAACTATGGSCVGVGSCGAEVGHLGAASCGAPHLACCITPATSCGGAEDFACCDASAEYRPTCQDGKLTCPAGQTRSTGAHCPHS